MNEEKYIKIIKRYLTCDKNKKEDICKELKADIDEAMMNGEAWVDIMQRLGDPKSVANEFNDNLGLSHKSYKKHFLIGSLMIVGIIVACIIYFKPEPIKEQPVGTSQVFDLQQVEKCGLEVVGYINNDQFDELYNISDETMKKAMAQEKIREAMNQFGELGDFKEVTMQKYVEIEQGKKLSVVGDVVVSYEKRTVIFRLSFDEHMKLMGLFVR